ncbi:MAG: arsenite methyltransferase [Dehalococcoidia bacterium]|jgi:arsenite methyltransferase|nr:arsenite methyltransferase [Dehalococcoidia bacterium]
MTLSENDQKIQQAVNERYGGVAERVLAASAARDSSSAASSSSASGAGGAGEQVAGAPKGFTIEFIESASASASCCGPDDAACACGSEGAHEHGSSSDDAIERPETVGIGSKLYESEQVSSLPEEAVLASLGCGNPVAIAELSAGERVLDLGSGGGIDCFLAGQQVGAEGEVWGLDMTPQMVRLARQNAEKVDSSNVKFRLGEIEDMPFEEDHFDVIISNCVINLSVDKPAVFGEAFRVLKPGGRLRVSDIVWTRDVPVAERGNIEEWAGCVAGALPLAEYTDAIRAAGFTDVSAEFEENERGLASAYVSAVKRG